MNKYQSPDQHGVKRTSGRWSRSKSARQIRNERRIRALERQIQSLSLCRRTLTEEQEEDLAHYRTLLSQATLDTVSRGYTIVEVLIGIAMLATLVGAGFGIYALVHFVMKYW